MADMKLAVKEGCFGYRDGTQILDHVNFEAESGDLIAVLGPNGAGKTTMLRCTLGFLRWTSGESTLDGRPIRTIPARELWQTIAYVPQARNFSSAATAEETVLLGRNAHLSVFSQPKQSVSAPTARRICTPLSAKPSANRSLKSERPMKD